MAANEDSCQWWFNKHEDVIFITRRKRGELLNIRFESMRAGSNHNVVKVRTANKEVIQEKAFYLTDFQAQKNDISESMSDCLGSNQKFIEKWQELCGVHKERRTFVQTNSTLQEKASTYQEENHVTDACDLDAINHKRVKFGNDYILEVPVHLLSSPPTQRLVRDLNQSHVDDLLKTFRETGNIIYNTLAVHIPNTFPMHVHKDDVLKGNYILEVLGGNHTRHALCEIDRNMKIPVTVYAGLSNDQALVIGYDHNKINEKSRRMTFSENVQLFRRKVPAKEEKEWTQTERVEWRKRMAAILCSSAKEVKMKYRMHSWLASRPNDLWVWIVKFMGAWENKTVIGQKPGDLKPHHMSFLKELDNQTAKSVLQKLINRDMSYKDTKYKSKPSAPKRKLDSNALQEWEKKLMEKEKRLKERENDVARRERELRQLITERSERSEIRHSGIMDVPTKSQTDQVRQRGGEDKHPSLTEDFDVEDAEMEDEDMEDEGREEEDREDEDREDEDRGDEDREDEDREDEDREVVQPDTKVIVQHEVNHKTTENSRQLTMITGEKFAAGEWVAVHYTGSNPYIGRVADIDFQKRTATVTFLKGKRLSTTDIQSVPEHFVICKVDLVHDIAKDQILVPQKAKQKMKKQKQTYLDMSKRKFGNST